MLLATVWRLAAICELYRCQRLLDAEPSAPEHHDHRPQSKAVGVIACVAHHADGLLNCRRIAG
jgi:predicted component of type VI protein secretion system